MSNPESIFDYINELRKADTPESIVSQKVSLILQSKARETDTPYRGHFELTPLCNLDCKMCYVHLEGCQMGHSRLLTDSEWINLIQQAIAAGMIEATLSGGECLTYPKFDEVYLYLKSKGIATTILTNGVLLNHDRIAFFQKYKPRKIQISLYGSSDSAYENVTGKKIYTTVIKNIIEAKNANLPIKISITPSRYMLPDVKNIIQLVKDIDVPYAINIGLMTPRDNTERNTIEHDISIEDYIDIIRYNRSINGRLLQPKKSNTSPSVPDVNVANEGLNCGAGRSTFSISWTGIMNPCTQMLSVASNPLKEGFDNAWESINAEVKAFPRFKDCVSCDYSSACDYCAAENEKLGSRFILNKKWCERTKKMVLYGLRSPNQQCD